MGALAVSILANVLLGAVLLAMLYRKRGEDSARLTDPAQALACYRATSPSAQGSATLSSDGLGALIDLADGGIGLVERRGRRWNARRLDPLDLAGVDAREDGVVTLRFADFGWPRARVALADPAARARWIERLEGLRREGAAGPHAGMRRA